MCMVLYPFNFITYVPEFQFNSSLQVILGQYRDYQMNIEKKAVFNLSRLIFYRGEWFR
jgi:hypothetical protein